MVERVSVLLPLLPRLAAGLELSRAEAARAMEAIVSGTEPVTRIAALLAMLRVRPPVADEIAGFADTLLAHAVRFPLPPGPCIDTCGTGGDGKLTFNVSTVTALVVAACGVSVVKHGNRSASGSCGSADLLEYLGVAIDGPVELAQRQLRRTGFAFLFAPGYHPVLRQVAELRREIGFPTVFNVLGPLLNPAGVRHQLLGVFDRGLQPLLAAALRLRGTQHAYVLHGEGGFDEAMPTGPVRVIEVLPTELREWTLDPASLGFERCTESDLRVNGAPESARIALDVLANRRSPHLDAVLLNAALAVHVAGAAPTLEAGVQLAREAVASGRAQGVLDGLRDAHLEGA